MLQSEHRKSLLNEMSIYLLGYRDTWSALCYVKEEETEEDERSKRKI
jgi:hypothetical protein